MNDGRMRAITYERYGPAQEVLELGEHPVVAPGAGEVRVSLAFSGVNPSDVKRRASARPGIDEPAFEKQCPHSDGAGVIEAVGEGVDPARVGERVWIWNGHWQRTWGTAAEKITLPSVQAVPLPDNVSFETGAQLGIPGLTAAHCVLGGGIVKGKWVLIHGGAGSVGYLAVQLAKWGGARIVATASPRDFDKCRQAGADVVVDYRSDRLPEDIRDAANGAAMERIVDVEFGENVETNTDIVAPNGVICVYGSQKQKIPVVPIYPLMFKAVTIDFALIYILPDELRRQAVENLRQALSEDALQFPTDQIFTLSQTVQAHESVERGRRKGATLIDVRR